MHNSKQSDEFYTLGQVVPEPEPQDPEQPDGDNEDPAG